MSKFKEYLKAVQEQSDFVDLKSSKYTVVVSVDSEKKGFEFEIGPNDSIAKLSQVLRQKSKEAGLSREISVALPLGFNNQTKLSKIFDEEKIEFSLKESGDIYKAVLLSKMSK